MQTTLFLIGGIVAGIVITAFLLKKRNIVEPKDDTALKLLLEQMNNLTRTVDQKLGDSAKEINQAMRHQASESTKIIQEVTEKLTLLDVTNKQVVGFTEQLEELQDILKNPKQRGILGEYYLEALLKNILPSNGYQMQYGFPDGTIVDAAVFIKDKIIPVDSKFSLDNYNRLAGEKDPIRKLEYEKMFVNDLKLRITETSKYIQPENGTMDFAFMFIPHEAIYYDLLVNNVGSTDENAENLIQRAGSKYKVIIVSPTSFLAYLQTVMQGLRALQIEETAKDIIKRVGELGKHLKAYDEYHLKLGNALGTAVSHYNNSGKEFKKLDKDVMRISEVSPELETLSLEKPNLED
ncbi:MAG: DNA recombination protein RmuC [Candidatus Pacebacteria bacterium]|nr:DNA recombination protein RmuC [Candidatus Paceibacterota bacterium]